MKTSYAVDPNTGGRLCSLSDWLREVLRPMVTIASVRGEGYDVWFWEVRCKIWGIMYELWGLREEQGADSLPRLSINLRMSRSEACRTFSIFIHCWLTSHCPAQLSKGKNKKIILWTLVKTYFYAFSIKWKISTKLEKVLINFLLSVSTPP